MTALDWLAVSLSLVGLALVALVGYVVVLFCRGCALVEHKDWTEDL